MKAGSDNGGGFMKIIGEIFVLVKKKFVTLHSQK